VNKEWSNLNKEIQVLLKKELTFKEGIFKLLYLRDILFQEMLRWKIDLDKNLFHRMPFINATGYHNKTVAYSLWHIFRIEDIVTHSLIKNDEQIIYKGQYKEKMNSPIITTGNELVKEEIADFSKALDIDALYEYIDKVRQSTDDILKGLTYQDLKISMTEEDKEKLESLHVVSKHDRSYWLIDYWCQKDIRGLIQMPLSRHWIMHVEASIRITGKLNKLV